jgi:hypothetical protein
MGAVFGESLRRLRAVLRCEDRQLNKVGRKMSDAALTGSMKIWQMYTKQVAQESTRIRGEGGDVTIDMAVMEDEEEIMREEDELGNGEMQTRVQRAAEEEHGEEEEVTEVEPDDLVEALRELAGDGLRESEGGEAEAETEAGEAEVNVEARARARAETRTETEARAEEAQATVEAETGAGARARARAGVGNPDGDGEAVDARTAFRRQGDEIQAIIQEDGESDSSSEVLI